ncbi:hypothetical protein B0T14DRAFT_290455 [Immersiella caudata]|uniref:NACHT domain-containing protein n=1 Tax=Immersiella caudata TaxID=314043 RepID=A0AA39WEI2_9PEZI|nr:hypothetical protein B0T14DRAFT_290455 [Immersiella caudata]
MLQGKKTKWKCFVAALRDVWNRKKVEEMRDQLIRLQTQVNSHIQSLISEDLQSISKDLKSLQLNDAKANLQMHSDLASTTLSLGSLGPAPLTLATPVETDEQKNRQRLKAMENQLKDIRVKVSNMEQNQRVLLSLWFESITIREENVAKAHASTFSWLFQEPSPDIHLSDWLQNQHGTFWIQGKAGSGKSTLMKFICTQPQTYELLKTWAGRCPLITARFFFWSSGTALQKSQEGLLRSLLFEILRQCHELVPYVRDARARYHNRGAGPLVLEDLQDQATFLDAELEKQLPWSREELLWTYRCIVRKMSSAKFCFFIDGLDEYKTEGNQDHLGLIETIHQLADAPHIKFCLSSRPWVVFSDAFGTEPRRLLRLEDLTRADIRQYVSDKLGEHSQYHHMVQMNSKFTELAEEVVEKAQGVFLWVYLVVRELLEGLTYNDTIKTMRLRLEQFPPDLDAFFQHMIESIPTFYRKETAQTFRLALSRGEPLPLLTYAFFDDVADEPRLGLGKPSPTLFGEQTQAIRETMRRRLDGRCKGLVEIVRNMNASNDVERDKVDFLHRTVRDYLVRSPQVAGSILQESEAAGELWYKAFHASYLSLRTLITMDPGTDPNVFYPRWAEVFAFARLVADARQDELATDHVLDDYEQVFPQLASYDLKERLCWASERGLWRYIRNRIPPRDAKGFAEYILSHVVGANTRVVEDLNPRLVSLLLGYGADPNSVYRNTLWWTGEGLDKEEQLTNGRPTISSRFIDNINTSDTRGTRKNILEVTELLLHKGPNLEEIWPTRGEGITSPCTVRTRLAETFTSSQLAWLVDGRSIERTYSDQGNAEVGTNQESRLRGIEPQLPNTRKRRGSVNNDADISDKRVREG